MLWTEDTAEDIRKMIRPMRRWMVEGPFDHDESAALELADKLAFLASERIDGATQALGDLADVYLAARKQGS